MCRPSSKFYDDRNTLEFCERSEGALFYYITSKLFVYQFDLDPFSIVFVAYMPTDTSLFRYISKPMI